MSLLKYGAVVALFAAGLAFAQEGPQKVSSIQRPKAFYDRVAALVGLDPEFTHEAMTKFFREGFDEKDALFFILLSQERTLERASNPEEARRIYKESINFYIEKTRERAKRGKPPKGSSLKDLMAEEMHITVPNLDRQAIAIIREVRIADRGEKPDFSGKPNEFPEYLSRSLVKRFGVREEVLREVWRKLEGINLRDALHFLVLAHWRTTRLIRVGAIAEGERESGFQESAQYFYRQFIRTEQQVGWGDLAIQVNRHANELNHEAHAILQTEKREGGKGGGPR